MLSMDESNTKVRAGVAFALAVVCVGVALFILSYTIGGGNAEVAPQPAPAEEATM